MDANDQRDSLHRHIVTSNSCFNDSTIKRFNVAKPFWRNVVLIALAHVALIAGLIRWSVAAKASSSPESIVWLDGAVDLSAGEPEKQESPAPTQQPSGIEYSEPAQNEAVDEKPVTTKTKSEIQFSEIDGNSNTGETKCHRCIKSQDNSKTNSQENSGGESLSKTGGKPKIEPSESERQVGEKRQNCSGKKGVRVSERKRRKRINR